MMSCRQCKYFECNVLKFAKGGSMYRLLDVGETILETDDYFRTPGWHLCGEAIDYDRCVTQSDPPIRRKIEDVEEFGTTYNKHRYGKIADEMAQFRRRHELTIGSKHLELIETWERQLRQ